MGCPQRRALRGGAAEDRDGTQHRDGAEESARAKVTRAQRLRRAERRAAPSFDGAADGCCADQEGTLKGVGLKGEPSKTLRRVLMNANDVAGKGLRLVSRLAGAVVAVPVIVGFVLLDVAV